MQPFFSTPRRALCSLVAAQIVAWTLVPLLCNSTLPLDVVREGLAWGVEWRWGYHKHPPLTTWLVDGAYRLLGDVGPYLLSQIAVSVTYLFVFLLGRRLMGERRAAMGTLLLAGIFYFSWPTPEFNHNLAQMPFWAAAIYLFHRAIREAHPLWWLALGAVAGAGLLVKYAMAVLLAVMALHVVSGARTRGLLRSPWPYAAVATAGIVVSPHIAWLFANDFAPLHYLQERGASRATAWAHVVEPFRFVLAQAADHLPMLALLAAAGLLRRITPPLPQPADPVGGEDRRFLLALAIGPTLLSLIAALVGGISLRDMWGAPMFNLSGLLAIHLLAPNPSDEALRRLGVAAVALLVAVSAAYGVRSLFGAALTGKPQRADWPDRIMASALEKAWAGRTACPLRIVAGDSWLAGLVSMRAEGRPAVLLEGDLTLSPWIGAERLRREGALLVWRIEGAATEAPAVLAGLGAAQAGEPLVVPWPRAPRVVPLRIGWAILPPACESRARTPAQ